MHALSISSFQLLMRPLGCSLGRKHTPTAVTDAPPELRNLRETLAAHQQVCAAPLQRTMRAALHQDSGSNECCRQHMQSMRK